MTLRTWLEQRPIPAVQQRQIVRYVRYIVYNQHGKLLKEKAFGQ